MPGRGIVVDIVGKTVPNQTDQLYSLLHVKADDAELR
jgi:hypothetical protein